MYSADSVINSMTIMTRAAGRECPAAHLNGKKGSVNPVLAATEILPVTSLNASYADGHVSYSGTVTSAVKAAAVLLYEFDGNLIMML